MAGSPLTRLYSGGGRPIVDPSIFRILHLPSTVRRSSGAGPGGGLVGGPGGRVTLQEGAA
ncbi:MAG: hypothetical protein EXR92_00425 [Gemmatimonadetes bacterium]|nr:hypothetical protein [Gemmatimonadota bacterium]